jgi:hypothetical protein
MPFPMNAIPVEDSPVEDSPVEELNSTATGHYISGELEGPPFPARIQAKGHFWQETAN